MPICDKQCLQNEREVLLDINRNMSGKDWIRKWDIDANDATLSNSSHCDWHGILCDNSTRHLMAIHLSGNNVRGELPVNLSNLQFLLAFRIGSNSIQGQFENIVATMPKYLVRLEIANSDITGRLPKDIANNLPLLSKLQMSGSKLSGEIPDSIGDLIHLTVLSLGETLVSGSIPQSISKLTNLWFLDLETLALTGNLSFLYNLRNLSYLHLSSNKIGGPIPEYIGERCPKLKDIRLSNNKLSGELPRSIGMLKSLEEMNVEKNNLSGLIPVDLCNLNLKVLVLSSNKFKGLETSSNGTVRGLTLFRASHIPTLNCSLDTIVSYLKGSRESIMQIDVSYSNVYGQIPKLIYSFNKLAFLKLSSNRLSGLIPTPSQNLPFFTLLDLQDNDLSGPIPLTFSRLKMITELNLKGNSKLRGPIASSFMLLDYQVAIEERKSDKCPTVRFAHNNGTVYVDSSYYDRQYCHCNENYFGNGKHCIPCISGGSCQGTTTAVSNLNPIKQLPVDQVQLPVSTMLLKQGHYPFPNESNVRSIHECPLSSFKICVPKENCACYVNTSEEIIGIPGSVVPTSNRTRVHCNKSCLCVQGHEGRHCSQCINDYYKDGIYCFQCPGSIWASLGIPTGILAAFILWFYRLTKISIRENTHSMITAVSVLVAIMLPLVLFLTHVITIMWLQIAVILIFLRYIGHFEKCAALFKSAMFYVQVMGSLVLSTDFLQNVMQIGQVFVGLSLNFRFSSFACYLQAPFTPLGKSIFVFLLPFAVTLTLFVIYQIMKCCTKKDCFKIEHKFRKYSLVIVDLTYFPIVKSSLSILVGCNHIEGVSFMKRYVWIDCRSSEYDSLLLVGFLELFFYVFAVPCIVYIPLLFYYRKDVSVEKSTASKSTANKSTASKSTASKPTASESIVSEWLSPLINAYKSKYKAYMELAILSRRLLIATLLEIFPANSLEQVLSITIVLVGAIIFQAIVRPFQSPTETQSDNEKYMGLENGIDIFMLSCVLLSFVYAGLFAGNEISAPSGLLVFILLINGFFLLALVCSIMHRTFPNFVLIIGWIAIPARLTNPDLDRTTRSTQFSSSVQYDAHTGVITNMNTNSNGEHDC